MNCQDIARLLDEKQVDELLADEQSSARVHLATCRDCARDWQIHAQLSNTVIPAVPAGLRARFPTQVASGSSPRTHWRSRLVVIGAMVAVATAATMLTLQMGAPSSSAVATANPLQATPSVIQGHDGEVSAPTEPMSADESKSVHEQKAVAEWKLQVAEWLAIRDDPDALITAALMLMQPPQDARRIQLLLQRAAEMAPDSARIHATAMVLCLSLKGCDSVPYEQALRRLAPDNALGWAGETGRSSRAGDEIALQRAMTGMSRAKTYDLYENASVVSMTAQILAARVAPPDIGNPYPPRLAIEIFATMPIPAFNLIVKPCRSASEEKTLLECRQIGAAMRAGDTVLVNMLGIELSGSGLPAGSAEALALAKQRRQTLWISMRPQKDDPADFLGVVADHPREVDAWRAWLEEHGIPTEPPADWKP